MSERVLRSPGRSQSASITRGQPRGQRLSDLRVVAERGGQIRLAVERIDNTEAADPGDASAQPNELSPVELIGPAEVVDDFGDRLAGRGVAFVMSKLKVLDGGSVFVRPLCGAQVHAYPLSVSNTPCQGLYR
jgi:hypothetical protein